MDKTHRCTKLCTYLEPCMAACCIVWHLVTSVMRVIHRLGNNGRNREGNEGETWA